MRPENTQIIWAYLVTIEGKEEFKGVVVKDLDSSVQERNCDQVLVGAVADTQDFIGKLERSHVHKWKLFGTL